MDTARTPSNPLCAVIVPTYHEAGNLAVLLPRLAKILQSVNISFIIVVVDDNSADGTEEIIERIRAEGVPVDLIVRKGRRGLSSAVIEGFNHAASAKYLVCMDGDLSHPPESIPEMLRLMETKPASELVVASRYITGGGTCVNWGMRRRVYSQCARLLAFPIVRLNDPLSGFFVIPKTIYARARNLHPMGYKIILELIVKCRCKKIIEIPIHFSSRLHGRSKLTVKQQLLYVLHVARLSLFKLFTS